MTHRDQIQAIIGLGNPGKKYHHNRHNIGFRIVDALVAQHHGSWKTKDHMEYAQITINGKPVIVVKPTTYMNDSGKVVPVLLKQGIKPENIMVVHDELELPFGHIKAKKGGSAKGHNGLKSIIAACGDAFNRLRFGIGRPANREDVPTFVLENFDSLDELESLIEKSLDLIIDYFS